MYYCYVQKLLYVTINVDIEFFFFKYQNLSVFSILESFFLCLAHFQWYLWCILCTWLNVENVPHTFVVHKTCQNNIINKNNHTTKLNSTKKLKLYQNFFVATPP